mmetsp:Transcript_5360/g.15765  ORF Transcript_5360/g.15765 Transcript_5360/m.15765 type:complete len:297 (+) Transcript_5360:535-1425(+)
MSLEHGLEQPVIQRLHGLLLLRRLGGPRPLRGGRQPSSLGGKRPLVWKLPEPQVAVGKVIHNVSHGTPQRQELMEGLCRLVALVSDKTLGRGGLWVRLQHDNQSVGGHVLLDGFPDRELRLAGAEHGHFAETRDGEGALPGVVAPQERVPSVRATGPGHVLLGPPRLGRQVTPLVASVTLDPELLRDRTERPLPPPTAALLALLLPGPDQWGAWCRVPGGARVSGLRALRCLGRPLPQALARGQQHHVPVLRPLVETHELLQRAGDPSAASVHRALLPRPRRGCSRCRQGIACDGL